MMAQSSESLSMHDTVDGKCLWIRQDLDYNENDLRTCHIVLTETFCGFLYINYLETSMEHATGHYKLHLLDTLTGYEIYHGNCWDFEWTSEKDGIHMNPKRLPSLIANENYVLVCNRDRTNFGSQKNNFFCLRVDSDKTCQGRSIGTGIEPVLHAKICSGVEEDPERVARQHNSQRLFSIASEPDMAKLHDQLDLLGFAFDNVVIGQVSFSYCHEDKVSFSAKTVFSVDLDKMMDMYEPCSVFSAIHFPLKQKMPIDCSPLHLSSSRSYSYIHPTNVLPYVPPDYYAYYETTDEATKIVGIVEVFENSDKAKSCPKLHLLKRSLEINELHNMSSSHKNSNYSCTIC